MARGKFSSPTLKLTKAEIEASWDHAVRASSGGCLISDAITKKYPHLSSVSTDMATIRVSDKKKGLRYTYLTPEIAQTLLLAYDQGWGVPDDRDVTIRAAVKTTKIVKRKAAAEARAVRLTELEEKETAGVLTGEEKRSLSKMRATPARPASEGKTEVPADPNNRTVHGAAPKQGPNNPNLLRGRNRQFGKKVARPAVLFEMAVQKEVDARLAEESQKA